MGRGNCSGGQRCGAIHGDSGRLELAGAMELGQGEAGRREMAGEVMSVEVEGVKPGVEVGWEWRKRVGRD